MANKYSYRCDNCQSINITVRLLTNEAVKKEQMDLEKAFIVCPYCKLKTLSTSEKQCINCEYDAYDNRSAYMVEPPKNNEFKRISSKD